MCFHCRPRFFPPVTLPVCVSFGNCEAVREMTDCRNSVKEGIYAVIPLTDPFRNNRLSGTPPGSRHNTPAFDTWRLESKLTPTVAFFLLPTSLRCRVDWSYLLFHSVDTMLTCRWAEVLHPININAGLGDSIFVFNLLALIWARMLILVTVYVILSVRWSGQVNQIRLFCLRTYGINENCLVNFSLAYPNTLHYLLPCLRWYSVLQ